MKTIFCWKEHWIDSVHSPSFCLSACSSSFFLHFYGISFLERRYIVTCTQIMRWPCHNDEQRRKYTLTHTYTKPTPKLIIGSAKTGEKGSSKKSVLWMGVPRERGLFAMCSEAQNMMPYSARKKAFFANFAVILLTRKIQM